MARTPKLSIWTNKNDFTVYYRGHKVFRGNEAQVEEFCNNFKSSDDRLSVWEGRTLSSMLFTIDGKAITEKSTRLFFAYAEDAGNWNGQPLVGGNVGGSKEDRGNLTQLKKAGLIETDYDQYEDLTWIRFTDAGKEFADYLGVGEGIQ